MTYFYVSDKNKLKFKVNPSIIDLVYLNSRMDELLWKSQNIV